MENRFDILTSVDVLNTLYGGISEPQVVMKQLQNSRELRIKVPGVDPSAIHVEITNNRLSAYYAFDISSAGKHVKLPYTIYNRQLPYFVDISNIDASVDGNELIIRLPYNELAHGYHKKIKTSED